MIVNSVKNFIKNGVYVFISMGIVYLFLLITGFWFFSALFRSTGTTLAGLTELIDLSVVDSSASVNDFLAYSFGEINWDADLFETIKQILTTGWLRDTLHGFFETLNVSTVGFEEQFNVIVNDFAAELKSAVAIAVSLCVLGVILANYATRYAIRRKTAKRGLKKFILAHTLVPLAQAAVIVVSLGLFSVIRLYSLLVFFAMLLLASGISLGTAWLVHRDETLPLKKVLNPKNILGQIAVGGLFLLFDLVLASVLMLLNPLLAVLLMIPVLLYTFNIADLNTDAYVCGLVNTKA